MAQSLINNDGNTAILTLESDISINPVPTAYIKKN